MSINLMACRRLCRGSTRLAAFTRISRTFRHSTTPHISQGKNVEEPFRRHGPYPESTRCWRSGRKFVICARADLSKFVISDVSQTRGSDARHPTASFRSLRRHCGSLPTAFKASASQMRLSRLPFATNQDRRLCIGSESVKTIVWDQMHTQCLLQFCTPGQH